jgi:hemerythrin-like domain-containing protein
MNAIRYLLKEHEEIGALFNEFADAGEEAHVQKKRIANEVIKRIAHHAKLEENILFPAFEKKGGKEAEDMVEEGLEEHQVVEFVMAHLKKLPAANKSFDAKFKVLVENAKQHFEEEELEVFPKVKKALGKDLERLGKEMAAMEKRMK